MVRILKQTELLELPRIPARSTRVFTGRIRIPGRAEALLHLRCIELNGDWDQFIAWSEAKHRKRLLNREKILIRSNEFLECDFAKAA